LKFINFFLVITPWIIQFEPFFFPAFFIVFRQ
jgi:hypothetical protein